ncbi:NAD(P)-dependent oxidoreductase [Candidatus Woesearchaeota archaeon]|nr:NAD(P)-dependent oxidoreductase [Candidatus Woesearchaeota archaeon]
MKKILITGSNGTIGKIIKKNLINYKFYDFDLPKYDARNYNDILRAMKGMDLVIHLGWDTKVENWKSRKINPDNSLMTFNIYNAAIEAGVPRVIMASSVHADDYSKWKGPGLMNCNTVPIPDSPYGASKIFMEALGRYYANLGLEVVCIRFMGLNSDNNSFKEVEESRKWFSHKDCARLIKSIINAPRVPNNFVVMYGVSNNTGRIHDFVNPFGWAPRDGK